jgi:hypothetical protein
VFSDVIIVIRLCGMEKGKCHCTCSEEKDFVMKGSKVLSAIMINFVVVWVILHIVWFTFSNGSSVFKW